MSHSRPSDNYEDGTVECTTTDDSLVQRINLDDSAEPTLKGFPCPLELAAPQPVRPHCNASANWALELPGAKTHHVAYIMSDTGLYWSNARPVAQQRPHSAICSLAGSKPGETSVCRSKSVASKSHIKIQSAPAPQDPDSQPPNHVGNNGRFTYASGTGSGHAGNNFNRPSGQRNGKQPEKRNNGPFRPLDNPASSATSLQIPCFPCIFHLWDLFHRDTGQPAEDPTPICAKKHDYISQIKVHHKCQAHGPFHYCTNCFETSKTNPVDHRDDPRGPYTCQFRCVTEVCPNYDKTPPYNVDCTHGYGKENGQRYTWRKLYRLGHGLGSHDWVPDPTVAMQYPPQTLSHDHPMAGLYNPGSSAQSASQRRNHRQAIQPRPTPIPPETVRDVQAQHIFLPASINTPMPTQAPGSTVPPMISCLDDRMFTNNGYSQQPLTDVDNQNSSRLSSATALAHALWPIVASPHPSLQIIPPLSMRMLRIFRSDPSRQIADDNLTRLNALVSHYVSIITDPTSRSPDAWRDVRLWTQAILHIDVSQVCPWQPAPPPQMAQAGLSSLSHPSQTSQQLHDLVDLNMPQILAGTGDTSFTAMDNTQLSADPWHLSGSSVMQQVQISGTQQMYNSNSLVPNRAQSSAPAHQHPSSTLSESFFVVSEGPYAYGQRLVHSAPGSELNFDLPHDGSHNGSGPGYSNTSG